MAETASLAEILLDRVLRTVTDADRCLLGAIIDDLVAIAETRPARSDSAEKLKGAVALIIDAAKAINQEDAVGGRRQ